MIGGVAVGLAAVLALTGCAIGGVDVSEPTSTEGALGEVEQSSWEDLVDPQLRLEGCLVGTWALDRDRWAAGIAGLLEGSGYDAVTVDHSGELHVVLEADESYVTTGADSRTVSEGSSPDGDIRWLLRFDGSERGTWSVESGRLALTAGEDGRLAAEHELAIDGEPLPTDMLPVSGTPWSEVLTVECDAERLVTIPATDPGAVEVVFLRAG